MFPNTEFPFCIELTLKYSLLHFRQSLVYFCCRHRWLPEWPVCKWWKLHWRRQWFHLHMRARIHRSNLRNKYVTSKWIMFSQSKKTEQLKLLASCNKISQLCGLDVDDCQNVTCHNNGSCVDSVNAYLCACAAGYTGAHCETGFLSPSEKGCIYFRPPVQNAT